MAKSRSESRHIKEEKRTSDSLVKEVPEYVGFGTRFISYMIDIIIIFFIGYGIQVFLGNDMLSIALSAKTLDDIVKINQPNLLSDAIGFGTAFLYYITFWTMNNGQTPGKMLMNIRIVRSDGSRLTLSNAFLRYVGFFISSLMLGIGFIWIIFDKNKQGLHDKLTNTFVVRSGKNSMIGITLAVIALLIYMAFMGAIFYKTYTLVQENITLSKNQENATVNLGNLHNSTLDAQKNQVNGVAMKNPLGETNWS